MTITEINVPSPRIICCRDPQSVADSQTQVESIIHLYAWFHYLNAAVVCCRHRRIDRGRASRDCNPSVPAYRQRGGRARMIGP